MDSQSKSTWIAVAIVTIIVVSVVVYFRIGKYRYVEFLNGWETGVRVEKQYCHEDSRARHYWVDVRTRTVTKTDSEGNIHIETETYTVHVPYTDYENNFYVDTTVGPFLVGDRFLPENPNNYRYWRFVEVPEEKYKDSTGVPEFWKQVKQRVAHGTPKHVTKKHTYDNYIYASDSTILHTFSENISRFKLPTLKHEIFDFYDMYKVYNPPTYAWQDYASRFNAEFGRLCQGDLYTVVVYDRVDPDRYGQALLAYWTGKAFERERLAKNCILLVLGTDGETVKWARMYTPMPCGTNYGMVKIQSELTDKPFKPEVIYGDVNFNSHGNGVLSKLMVEGACKFKRDKMRNYEYLR